MVRTVTEFRSGPYWEARYRQGGTSGAGSYGRLAQFKANVINAFVADNRITSVMDLGCGDGNLLSMLDLPAYVGVDVSAAALARCAARFPQYRFVPLEMIDAAPSAELAMSIDVIFHLVEDPVFVAYMAALFGHATRFAVFYSSNFAAVPPDAHVRHRRFTDYIEKTYPAWRLLCHLPNRYPYERAEPSTTSFADFFIYGCSGEACVIRLPAA